MAGDVALSIYGPDIESEPLFTISFAEGTIEAAKRYLLKSDLFRPIVELHDLDEEMSEAQRWRLELPDSPLFSGLHLALEVIGRQENDPSWRFEEGKSNAELVTLLRYSHHLRFRQLSDSIALVLARRIQAAENVNELLGVPDEWTPEERAEARRHCGLDS